MHVTTKETDDDGVHIVSTVVEADGPFELASEKASISAGVISTQRTASGGIKVQVAIRVFEPAPASSPAEEAVAPSPDQLAAAYFEEKGYTTEDAKQMVAKFGASRVLAMREKELDDQLVAAVAPPEPPAPAEPGSSVQ